MDLGPYGSAAGRGVGVNSRWRRAGFVAVEKLRAGTPLREDAWRYPEFGWTHWLPGLEQTRRVGVEVLELWFWVDVEQEKQTGYLAETLLAEQHLDQSRVIGFDVVGLDGGRLVALCDAILDTPLEESFDRARVAGLKTLDQARDALVEAERVSRRENLQLRNTEVVWLVTAFCKVVSMQPGDPGLSRAAGVLLSFAEQRRLRVWALAASRSGDWFQFALDHEERPVRAECYVSAVSDTLVEVRFGDGSLPDAVFVWPTRRMGSALESAEYAVQLVGRIGMGAVQVRRRLFRHDVIVHQPDGPVIGKAQPVLHTAEGPLAFAFG